jgi:limonene-1,2-epoxide hydrolase
MQVKNKQIVKKIIEVFINNNQDAILNYLADNIKWNIVGMPQIRGKKEFINAINSLELENFSTSEIKNVISEGEFVVVESIGQLTAQINSFHAPSYCDIYRIKYGKVCELTTYIIDTASNNEN